ncbi:hypothetical protein TcasGA2_TC034495 [Tribolium castaneum]|uniref:Reverse transcriptase domain-containing protein n=1 Tax=Tribolium castaneum TaxID=7070 RepID=A0A139W9A2_TRICA|nr:hypothetical protein TcasGA2_TC034495 [Tribolium castaneum]
MCGCGSEGVAVGLKRITCAPLKPQQRMHLLRVFFLPKFYHAWTFGRLNAGVLRRLDVVVRTSVRTWLRLPHDIPVGYFHAPTKSGGLGIPQLSRFIPFLRLKRFDRLGRSAVDYVRECAFTDIADRKIRWCRERLSGIVDQVAGGRDALDAYWTAQLHQSVDGRALRESASVASSTQWLRCSTRAIPASDWLHYTAVHIGALPSRGRRGGQDVSCRGGCLLDETPAHCIQVCHRTHGGRVLRHDAIAKRISADLMELGWIVTREEGVTVILDVQIVSPAPTLDEAHRRKVAKYRDRADLARTRRRRRRSGKSFFLHERSSSMDPLAGRYGLEREEHRSCGGVRIFPSDLENPGEGHVEASRRFVPISAAGLQGEEPLVDRIMIGSEDRGVSGLARKRVAADVPGLCEVKRCSVSAVNVESEFGPVPFGLPRNRLAARLRVRPSGRPEVLFGRHSTVSSELARTGGIRLGMAFDTPNEASDLEEHGSPPPRIRPGTNCPDNPIGPMGADHAMDMDSEDEAGAHGPPADSAHLTSGEPLEIILMLPFQSRSCGICLNAGKGNFRALSLDDEERHLRERHPLSLILYKCSDCKGQYRSKRAALCHAPKCTGPTPDPQGNALRCHLCGLVCKSQSGVTQHLRHRHPLVRNTQRAAEESGRAERAALPRPLRRNTRSVFSEEDEAKMLELEVRFQNERCVAKCMLPFFPNRTCKQIRDKRNTDAYKRRRELYFEGVRVQDPAGAEDSVLPVVETDEPAEENIPLEYPELPGDEEGAPACSQTILNTEGPDGLGSPPVPVEEEMASSGSTSNNVDTGWRESIITAALGVEIPKAISQEPAAVIQELQDALREAVIGVFPQDRLDEMYERVLKVVNPDDTQERPKRQRKKGKSRNAFRRYVYSQTQDLFKKNPGQLARYVREDVRWLEQGRVQLQRDDIERMYNKPWGTKPNVLPPTSLGLSSASGHSRCPDGLQKRHLVRRVVQEILRLLYNLLMCCAMQPTQWRMNRTQLLLKQGKDPPDVASYRPITISSILCRLYWGIIDQKLREHVRFHPRQKGFVSEAGCFNNVQILNELLRHSKGQHKNLVAVCLDVSKAFDTVPHSILGPALRMKGLPEQVVRLVEDSYKDLHTVVKQGTAEVTLSLQRGVKQGDPPQPLLIQRSFGTPFTAAGESPGACTLLRVTEDYLERLGMRISAPKCTSFEIRPTKDSWYVADPGLTLTKGERIPVAAVDAVFSYLGVEISPWAGITSEGIERDWRGTLHRVQRLALKPHQKLELISRYLVPHFLYKLVVTIPSITLIRQLDQELRVVVKQICHLPQSTADGMIYCRKVDGGLGIPKLEIVTVTSILKAGLKFRDSQDKIMQALWLASGMSSRLNTLAKATRVQPWPPNNIKDLDRHKVARKKEELARWASLTSQGKSVKSFAGSRTANAWLINKKLLKPSIFISALRLRGNVAGDRVALNRAIPQANLMCRRCGSQRETLGHILGICTSTKALRISRHDEIKNLIVDEAAKKDDEVAVTLEPTIRHPVRGNLKPDLVVQNREGVYVVDVTVRHEDGNLLAQGRQDKLDKYEVLLPILQERLGAPTGEVLPIVVGTRGAMPKETVEALKKLRITDRQTLLTISLIALRMSVKIYHTFMDYANARPRPGGGANYPHR